MKVLSIDLDYIMGKSIHLYEDIGWNDNPHLRWSQYFSQNNNHSDLCIDEKNLYYCLDVFLKSIKNCTKVSFSYNHDSILDEIINYDNIELINIDHHDDIIYHLDDHDDSSDNPMRSIEYMKSLHKSYELIKNNYVVHEGNWISLLNIMGKLKSYTFIGNEESTLFPEKKSFISKKFPQTNFLTKEEYNFSDYNFDYIFVCLSPQFIPPFHWHYFYIFISIYENITGNIVDFNKMPIRNYSTNYAYSEVTAKIKFK